MWSGERPPNRSRLRPSSRTTPHDPNMKLAEALILRADNQKRLSQLKARIVRVAKVQEGDQPSENPGELLREYDHVATELERLIRSINRTNLTTPFESGTTLTDALASRDVLTMRLGLLRELAEEASVTENRYSRSEVKFISTVDVAAIQKQADDLSRRYRELDSRIQAMNWTTESIVRTRSWPSTGRLGPSPPTRYIPRRASLRTVTLPALPRM